MNESKLTETVLKFKQLHEKEVASKIKSYKENALLPKAKNKFNFVERIQLLTPQVNLHIWLTLQETGLYKDHASLSKAHRAFSKKIPDLCKMIEDYDDQVVEELKQKGFHTVVVQGAICFNI